MEEVTRRTVLALAMPIVLLAVAGCEAATATSGPGGDMNPADLEFVTQAYNIITFDREEGSLAPIYAQSPAVRKIAAELLNNANAFATQLDPIVKARGINLPTDLRTDLRVRLLHIRLDRGLYFDHSFIDDQIASHQEVLDRREMFVGTPGQNPQLLALAKEGMEEVRQSLAELRVIQRQLPTPPTMVGPFGLPPLPHTE